MLLCWRLFQGNRQTKTSDGGSSRACGCDICAFCVKHLVAVPNFNGVFSYIVLYKGFSQIVGGFYDTPSLIFFSFLFLSPGSHSA